GLFYGDDIEAMLRHAHDQGRITHADPRCSAGAAAIAGAVALVSRGHPADSEMLLDKLQGYASRFDPTFAANLRQLRDWVRLPPETAACGICSAGLPPGVDSQWCGGISAFVVASVLWALYAFLRNPDNYGETIATAILPGGDTDTAAAMAGALSGARLGLSAIPGELMSSLNDRGAWKAEDLVVLADACWQVAQ
ncbi:MAG: ADP-ribosylglycohydrolase family protein, partial [Rhodospirillales bacterium]|nr:ADP-ribosylglycohydrolase family protein [Rhodospirillales bacterium]